MLLTAGFQLKILYGQIYPKYLWKNQNINKYTPINSKLFFTSSYRIATIALQFRSQQSNFSSEFINHLADQLAVSQDRCGGSTQRSCFSFTIGAFYNLLRKLPQISLASASNLPSSLKASVKAFSNCSLSTSATALPTKRHERGDRSNFCSSAKIL